MQQRKILFIDRDGTLIVEPEDKCIDHLDKLEFIPGVFNALLQLQHAGFMLVMVSNQDGLGSDIFPEETFAAPHDMMMRVFNSQGIRFDAIHICPHMPDEGCDCRKPKVGLLLEYLTKQMIDIPHSYVIGDRETDLQLAKNLGIKGIRFGFDDSKTWEQVVKKILLANRVAEVSRKTKETQITTIVDLDSSGPITIQTGLGFFDHMLEQIAKQGGFSLQLNAVGDLHIDDHHTVEDVALTLGQAIKQAVGDKWGIGRYGFSLPMDESLAQVSIDLSGRPFCVFKASFNREKVNDLATELVSHFFQSLAQSLGAAIHVEVYGENDHHMIEAIFKGVGRALRPALARVDSELPSTKGVL